MPRITSYRLAAIVLLACALAGCNRQPSLAPIPEIPRTGVDPQVAAQMETEITRLRAEVENDQVDLEVRAGAYLEMARLFHAYSLFDSAAVLYQNALALDPTSESSLYLLAVVQEAAGQAAEASGNLQRLLAANPQHLGALDRLARLELVAGRFDSARDLHQRALEVAPRNATSLAGLGRAALAAGDYEGAIQALESALKLQPQATRLHALLAQAHARLGDDEAAATSQSLAGDGEVVSGDAELHRVDQLAKGIGGLLRRGDAALRAGDYAAAASAYQEAALASPDDASVWHSLAAALFRSGRLIPSLQAYERAAGLRPDDADLWFNLGVVYARLGRLKAAITHYGKALELRPESQEIVLGLSEALLLDNRAAEALAVLSKGDHQLTVEGLLIRGASQLALGRAAEASSDVRQALEKDPLNANVHLLRLRIDATERQSLQLVGDDETFAQLPPGASRSRFARGVANHYWAAQIPNEAIGWLRRAVAEQPQPSAFLELAEVLSANGNVAEAVIEYRNAIAAAPRDVALRARVAHQVAAGGDCGGALELLQSGLASDATEPTLNASLVRLLSTCPDEEVRDGQRAVQIASQLVQRVPSITNVEQMAMAFAEAGDFAKAVEWQQRLIASVGSEANEEWLRGARQNLDLYQRRQPVRLSH